MSNGFLKCRCISFAFDILYRYYWFIGVLHGYMYADHGPNMRRYGIHWDIEMGQSVILINDNDIESVLGTTLAMPHPRSFLCRSPRIVNEPG